MVSTSNNVNVTEIFDALETWIKQKPGLDPRNYDRTSYRAEIRQIGRDRDRAMKALDEARGLTPAHADLLMEAFSAFSGRLEWKTGDVKVVRHGGTVRLGDAPRTGWLEYTTGQYWPTEYRKAAAAVLESYIALWMRRNSQQNPKAFTYSTIEDVKAANRQIGNHWFDRDTMRFFNTRIESGLIGGKYFITSEKCHDTDPKRYSVRVAESDGTIDTLGEFQQYETMADARAAIQNARM